MKTLIKLLLIFIASQLITASCYSQADESITSELGNIYFNQSGHDFIMRYKDGSWHSSLHDSLEAINAIFSFDSIQIIKNAGRKKIIISLTNFTNYLIQMIDSIYQTQKFSHADSIRIKAIKKTFEPLLQKEYQDYLFFLKVYPLDDETPKTKN